MLGADIDDAVSAKKSERNYGRGVYRSSYYNRALITQVGRLELRVPQDPQGRFRTQVF